MSTRPRVASSPRATCSSELRPSRRRAGASTPMSSTSASASAAPHRRGCRAARWVEQERPRGGRPSSIVSAIDPAPESKPARCRSRAPWGAGSRNLEPVRSPCPAPPSHLNTVGEPVSGLACGARTLGAEAGTSLRRPCGARILTAEAGTSLRRTRCRACGADAPWPAALGSAEARAWPAS